MIPIRSNLRVLTRATAAALLFCVSAILAAEPPKNQAAAAYQLPPKPIADLIDALPTPGVNLSPDNAWLLISEQPALPPISELAEPELRLAGMRINPRTNGASREFYIKRIGLKRVSDGVERVVTGLPADDLRITRLRWSPDSKHIAFFVTRETGIELWVAEVESGAARRLTDARISAFGRGLAWVSDNMTLVVRMVPEGRREAPPAPLVPAGPVIQESAGRVAPNRTYQDLLKNAYDEALFDHYLTSQLALVSIDGTIRKLAAPAVITDAIPSPDGKYLFVEIIHRPYSYLVPVSRFPHRAEVWDMDGKLIRQIADLPLAEEVPVDFAAVPTGPRSFSWRDDKPNTLVWVEAQDGGDPKKQADIRDRAYALSAPFTGEPIAFASTALRFGGIQWSSDSLALLSEWWWQNRKTKTWIIDPSQPGKEPVLLWDRSSEDRYSDPGSPVTKDTPFGTSVLLTADNGKSLFLNGDGASPEGDRPFLDRLNLATHQTKRLFHSKEPNYEYVAVVLDPEKEIVITRRESVSIPPNYYVRNLSESSERTLTAFPHPQPQLAGVHKELIRYERADGVKLTGTLYLPPGKKTGDGPFPMLMWAYPQEFKSADAAGQVTDSPHRFVRTSAMSPLLWLVHGFAVLDDPSLPIVGEGDAEPNDTYVKQLVAGAQAAVDEVVRRGVADRERIAIGGHSYGAFMTANLLAHCDLFCAGVARSGAYNRTLTPFSFQAEERTFWKARDAYIEMSPFTHADKVNEPILLIHGEADNNSGTFPMQTERFYNALKGLGATARFVLLPHESHGYRARESVMHVAHETTQWLDRYVKNAPTKDPTKKGASGTSQ